jgi:hypothetical protein
MPSILGRSNALHGSKRHSRSSSSYPALTSPVIDDATRQNICRTGSLLERKSQSSVMFQILSTVEQSAPTHESYCGPSGPISNTSRTPIVDVIADNSAHTSLSARNHSTIENSGHRNTLWSSLSHIKSEVNEDEYKTTVKCYKHQSSSSPAIFGVLNTKQLKMSSCSNDDSQPSSWGHYIDVTMASEELDRKIDLYREQRKNFSR